MARTQTKSDAAVSQRRGVVGNLDPIWDQVRHEAEAVARNESALTNFVLTSVLNQPSLEAAVIHRVASRRAHPALSWHLNHPDKMIASRTSRASARPFAPISQSASDRPGDPAWTQLIGALALLQEVSRQIQTYRLAHWLWHRGRRDLALYLQSVSSETFQTDINPQATIGKGIFLDHATGLVVGATASVDDDVSILQDVTLGGTGKESGDRHPKIRCGVLIGAGAKILGNIEVGHCARVAAGSVVLEPVPHNTTVAGVPARVVGTAGCAEPARTMDQILAEKQGR